MHGVSLLVSVCLTGRAHNTDQKRRAALIDRASTLLHAPWQPYTEHEGLWKPVHRALTTVTASPTAEADLLEQAQAVLAAAQAASQVTVCVADAP